MSAAVNDRPHEIVPLPHLPLTGELHPLRREFARWLATGNMITIAIAVVVCATIYFWPRPAPPGYVDIPIVDPRVISPPPIDPHSGGGGEQFTPIPDVGKVNYDPTDDKEILKPLDPVDNQGSGGPETGEVAPIDGSQIGGPLVDIPAPAPPADNGIFIPFDTPPVLLSIDAPVYPSIVRETGIEGTVMVRVFVALNGHVKDAYAVDGPAALREAAVTSARTGYFKPALQGTHPVEVWVVIPITFELRERY
ncbi:MAG TPA: TonB family protein [Candidatus Krumholzibacteria bacterium]|nr:TonB family protein [Candidatus Krumholzibacteria bacterium]